tara:strand:+ start:917 stop:1327 length:411 start_codon:yes stop_codon:yes gene_type:complete
LVAACLVAACLVAWLLGCWLLGDAAREKYFNILLTPTTQRITPHKGHEKKSPSGTSSSNFYFVLFYFICFYFSLHNTIITQLVTHTLIRYPRLPSLCCRLHALAAALLALDTALALAFAFAFREHLVSVSVSVSVS